MKNQNLVPKLADLISEQDTKLNDFQVLLNQSPPEKWVKVHPFIKNKDEKGKDVPYKYIPREIQEYLLTRIFTNWWLEIKDSKLVGNSIVVTVRLYVTDPVSGNVRWQDGIGAFPLQTNKGAGALDFVQSIKSAAVQMAAPAAETYAFKDACEKFGKLFGKDLNVRDINYNDLLKKNDSSKPVLASKGKDHIKKWNEAVKAINDGLVSVDQIAKKYEVSIEDLNKLNSYEKV